MSAWIKVSQTVIEHEKTFILAEELNLEEVQVVGYLIALWAWAIDHHPDGVLPANDKLIAKACRWSGPPEPFVKSLVFAGFLDDNYIGKNTGRRTIHNWDLYAGSLIRMREANKKRQRKHRSISA